jgi:electron transport complex protein RnfC
MRLLKFKGGIHPKGHKEATCSRSIEAFPLPEYLYLPVQQHIGAAAEPEVQVGQRVLKGQLLAHSQGAISAPIHSPASGIVSSIEDLPAPHPSGLPVKTIVIKTDDKDEWVSTSAPIDPFKLSAEEIALRVGAAGIVGLGGATFPSAVKLNLRDKHTIHTLVMNGAECEPYLTCDDRLMQERASQIIDGVRIMQTALGASKVIIAIESNKKTALDIMQEAAVEFADVEIVKVPTRYPMGSEKHLIKAVTGKEVPARALSADLGMIVHNVGTAFAIHKTIRYGVPLLSRIVTISGGAIKEPRNLDVPLGTRVADVLEYCGGLIEQPARLLTGGPMMGQTLPHTNVPIVKGTSGILALTAKEVADDNITPCIRCGSCVTACPCGLVPLEMAKRANKGDFDGAIDYGLMDCISCGSCAFVCPSHIPLVQYFNFAKGSLKEKQQADKKASETRRLSELRTARLDLEKKLKEEAAARRKAERAAKKKAAEAKQSASANADVDKDKESSKKEEAVV